MKIDPRSLPPLPPEIWMGERVEMIEKEREAEIVMTEVIVAEAGIEIETEIGIGIGIGIITEIVAAGAI